MPQFGKLLGQARPADANAATLYTKQTNYATQLNKLFITETAGGTPTVRVFWDDDGSTYDQSNAILYDHAMTANGKVEINFEGAWMSTDSGTIGVRTSVANQVTFTLTGEEFELNV